MEKGVTMNKTAKLLLALAVLGSALGAAAQTAPQPATRPAKPLVQGWATERVEEKIDRGMLATLNADGKVYLGWRLLRTDPTDVAFNVYRAAGGGDAVKLNAAPLAQTTDFIDPAPPADKAQYFVRPVSGGTERDPSEKASLDATAPKAPAFKVIKLQDPKASIQKVGVADLNGDGKYDFVVKTPADNIDPYGPYWQRSPDTYKLEAYLADGTFLWRKDLGWSIERGIWYSPYLVYDFDGDGKAEVAVKTGEGDPRDADGRVTSGPEWLSILDGATGQEVTRIPWIPRDPRIGEYNHFCRNQLGVAFLDGKTPCLLMERGTYQVMVLEAFQFRNKKLEQIWHWDSTEETGKTHYAQGAHFMHSADIDGDGREEVVLGSNAIDDNGQGMWSTVLGHPDKSYVGDIDPNHPGMEIFYSIEPKHKGNGVLLVDAKTGQILWGKPEQTWHVGEGLCGDIDSSIPGMECWAGESGKGDPKKENYGGNPPRWLFSAQGKALGTMEEVPPLTDAMAWWDGDLLREIPIRNSSIYKYGKGVIEKGITGRVLTSADIEGDWREELVTGLPGELRIYTTAIPAEDRRVCLMQDPVYRHDVAHNAMAYVQPPMVSYYLGYKEVRPFEKTDAAELAKVNKLNKNDSGVKKKTEASAAPKAQSQDAATGKNAKGKGKGKGKKKQATPAAQ